MHGEADYVRAAALQRGYAGFTGQLAQDLAPGLLESRPDRAKEGAIVVDEEDGVGHCVKI
jgi:hypothetical protein